MDGLLFVFWSCLPQRWTIHQQYGTVHTAKAETQPMRVLRLQVVTHAAEVTAGQEDGVPSGARLGHTLSTPITMTVSGLKDGAAATSSQHRRELASFDEVDDGSCLPGPTHQVKLPLGVPCARDHA